MESFYPINGWKVIRRVWEDDNFSVDEIPVTGGGTVDSM
jgi:hypothetical protein